jgi:hypothetical protein
MIVGSIEFKAANSQAVTRAREFASLGIKTSERPAM